MTGAGHSTQLFFQSLFFCTTATSSTSFCLPTTLDTAALLVLVLVLAHLTSLSVLALLVAHVVVPGPNALRGTEYSVPHEPGAFQSDGLDKASTSVSSSLHRTFPPWFLCWATTHC